MRLVRVLRLIVINLAVLAGGLLLIELMFGNWLGRDPLTFIVAPRNGDWTFEVDYRGVPESERRVRYRRDTWGLRGDYGTPADIDLLTVGGSTTEQKNVSEGYTFQDVMEMQLREAGFELEVANAGISGRTTFGHLYDFREWFPLIEGLAPRYVLLYVGINDMFRDQYLEQVDRISNPGDDSLKTTIKTRSALYRFYRTTLGVYMAKELNLAWGATVFDDPKWTDQPFRDNYREILATRLDNYRERLLELVEEIRKMGATPVMVTQRRGDIRLRNGVLEGLETTIPHTHSAANDSLVGQVRPGTINGLDMALILGEFNRVLMEVCEQSDGICIDLATELAFSEGDFFDHMHTTRAGSRKIGIFLADRLAPHLEQAQN